MQVTDDLIRGVTTTDDPMYGTSQHSNLYDYHWTDGYGNYRNSNDPNFNPSQFEAGNWQLTQETKLLCPKFHRDEVDTGDVATRPVEAGDKPRLNRVPPHH